MSQRLLLLAASLLPVTLTAHDMWIEPTAFLPQTGQIIGVRLRVGQDLLGDPIPRVPALVNEFIFEDGSGRKPIVGRDGSDPAGFVRVAAPGLLVLGYRSNFSPVELPAEKFNQYLKEEGLDSIAAFRARRNESGAKGREVFLRCAKALVLSGRPRQAQGDRRLGFTLELVAERNPYTLRAGQDLPVRLTYENRPLPGALIVAINRLNPEDRISARSDKDGRANLRLRGDGMWMIKAVHMIPAPAGSNADWASYWASLTFEMPASSARSR